MPVDVGLNRKTNDKKGTMVLSFLAKTQGDKIKEVKETV